MRLAGAGRSPAAGAAAFKEGLYTDAMADLASDSTGALMGAGTKKPASNLFRRMSDLIFRRNGGPSPLEAILTDQNPDHPLTKEERLILGNLVTFGKMRVEDVMVPRADIDALEAEASFAEALARFAEVAHSRMPLYRETLDDPIGMVHVKDLLPYVVPAGSGAVAGARDALSESVMSGPEAASSSQGHSLPSLSRLKRPVLFVPPSMPVADLLVKMQTTRMHMALVIDEYGGTDGLVTIEDLVEQIVGDIEDEHDTDESPRLVRLDETTFDADARVEVEEFETAAGLRFDPADHEEADTMGGVVFNLVGRVPNRGEIIRHPNGLEFEIVEADPRRIKRLKVSVSGVSADAASETGSERA